MISTFTQPSSNRKCNSSSKSSVAFEAPSPLNHHHQGSYHVTSLTFVYPSRIYAVKNPVPANREIPKKMIYILKLGFQVYETLYEENKELAPCKCLQFVDMLLIGSRVLIQSHQRGLICHPREVSNAAWSWKFIVDCSSFSSDDKVSSFMSFHSKEDHDELLKVLWAWTTWSNGLKYFKRGIEEEDAREQREMGSTPPMQAF
ncbi:hypothetical protein Rs2_39782 [Raphanus sativus]|nr:hypothetical protein Rs2_39782 [Raphanus sativus]